MRIKFITEEGLLAAKSNYKTIYKEIIKKGKTIVELAVRQKYRINVLATKCNGNLEPLPGPTHCFRADETIFVLGSNRDLQRFLNL